MHILVHISILFLSAVVFVRFVEPAYTFGEAMGVGFIEVEKTGIVEGEFSVIVRGGSYFLENTNCCIDVHH